MTLELVRQCLQATPSVFLHLVGFPEHILQFLLPSLKTVRFGIPIRGIIQLGLVEYLVQTSVKYLQFVLYLQNPGL